MPPIIFSYGAIMSADALSVPRRDLEANLVFAIPFRYVELTARTYDFLTANDLLFLGEAILRCPEDFPVLDPKSKDMSSILSEMNNVLREFGVQWGMSFEDIPFGYTLRSYLEQRSHQAVAARNKGIKLVYDGASLAVPRRAEPSMPSARALRLAQRRAIDIGECESGDGRDLSPHAPGVLLKVRKGFMDITVRNRKSHSPRSRLIKRATRRALGVCRPAAGLAL